MSNSIVKKLTLVTTWMLMLCLVACSSYEQNPLTNPNTNGINANCPAPNALTFSTSGNAHLILHITPVGNESLWQVQYGPAGFVPGQGTSIISQTTTVNVMGLNPNITYDFYVRAKCETNGFSAWYGPATVQGNGGGGNNGGGNNGGGNNGGGNNGGGNNGGGNNGGGNNGGGGSSTGDYLPLAVNNIWNYSQNGIASFIKVISTETLNGNAVYHVTNDNGMGNAYNFTYRKGNGDYYNALDPYTTNIAGGTRSSSGYEKLILKDYLNVGDTWESNYTEVQTIAQGGMTTILNLSYSDLNEIAEKGISVTIGSTTYTDVIHVSCTTDVTSTMTVGGITVPSASQHLVTEMWFAKNVGMIKRVVTSLTSTATSELSSYQLF